MFLYINFIFPAAGSILYYKFCIFKIFLIRFIRSFYYNLFKIKLYQIFYIIYVLKFYRLISRVNK